jgi:hypothetical protein
MKTLKNFMLSSWNGDGAPRIRTDLQPRSKFEAYKKASWAGHGGCLLLARRRRCAMSTILSLSSA